MNPTASVREGNRLRHVAVGFSSPGQGFRFSSPGQGFSFFAVWAALSVPFAVWAVRRRVMHPAPDPAQAGKAPEPTMALR